MDSYSYRDGSGRSPPERGWNSRDDRMKDERTDSFYRGRSPGAFYLNTQYLSGLHLPVRSRNDMFKFYHY